MNEHLLNILSNQMVGAIDFLDFLNKFQKQGYIILGAIGIGALILGGVSQDFSGTIKIFIMVILGAVAIAIFGNLEAIAKLINDTFINIGSGTLVYINNGNNIRFNSLIMRC